MTALTMIITAGRYRGPVSPAVCKTVEMIYHSAWFDSGPGLFISECV